MMVEKMPMDLVTFRHLATTDDKLDAIFKTLSYMYSQDFESGDKREIKRSICDERFEKIEKSNKWNKGISGFFGLVGGYLSNVVGKILGL